MSSYIRALRIGLVGPGRDRAALEENPGALLAPAAQGKGSDARADGGAAKEGNGLNRQAVRAASYQTDGTGCSWASFLSARRIARYLVELEPQVDLLHGDELSLDLKRVVQFVCSRW
jgi:hypothetical protein